MSQFGLYIPHLHSLRCRPFLAGLRLGRVLGPWLTIETCLCRKDEVEDTIVLRMESGDDAVLGQRWEHALYIAAGADPYQLVESAVAGAAALSGSSKPLRQKQLPPTLDVFGWCTWDAFYSRVSARGVASPSLMIIAKQHPSAAIRHVVRPQGVRRLLAVLAGIGTILYRIAAGKQGVT